MNLQDDLIIITTSNYKKKLIEENKLQYNLKVYTKGEFIKEYYHDYKKDILLHMKNKYNIIPEIAKIMLDNLYKIENKKYETQKLNNLVKIKNELTKDGYIIINNNFKTFIKDKKIICYNIEFDNYESYYDEYPKKEKIIVNKYQTIEEEVVGTAIKIKELIDNNIDINKIKINTLDGSYTGIIDRIFSFYNIPYQFNNNIKLYYLDDVKKFINEIDLDTNILDINLENINEKIANKIISIINKYTNYEKVSEIKDILIYEFKNTNIEIEKYENVIEEINYKNYIPKDDEYIFMLGFNQDIIPKIHKNDLYLNDNELKSINEETSLARNIIENKNLTKFIHTTKNLIISYKLESPSQNFGYSNFLTNFDNIEEISNKYDYKNEKLNKLYLADRLDNYILYNDVKDDLIDLYSNYENMLYNNYDNNYEKIDYSIIKKQLNNKINLSYSNINTFFQCQFRFMLTNIYKLDPFKSSISTIIGKLFHKVLELVYKYNITDYDETITKVFAEYFPEKTKKEEFYLKKYRKAILELIEILNENLEKTQFENTYFEQYFEIERENDLKITIKGFVDKIMTLNDGENTYVIVIDYKTGGMHNDIKKVVYGLDMQLLMYLYLIKNTDLIKNPKFSGMYLQQVMTEVLNKDYKKTMKQQKRENTKLIGYTIDDVNIIEKIDKKYYDDSFIHGMKLKKDNTFASSAKILSEDEIDKFIDIVSDNINKVIMSLNNSDFVINPKKMGKDNLGCKYCKFHDICYMNNSNIIELESGEENDENTE